MFESEENKRLLEATKRVILFLTSFALVISLAGCQKFSTSRSSPEGTARGFFRAIFSGDADKALDYVCIDPDSGLVFMVAVELDWKEEDFEILSSDDQSADVLATGRIKATAQDMQKLFELLAQENIPELPEYFKLPKVGVGVQANIYFDHLTVVKNRNKWCIPESSSIDFWVYLTELILKEIEGQ